MHHLLVILVFFYLFGEFTLMKPALSQAITSIDCDTSLCTTAAMTAIVTADSSTYHFDWFINDGTGTVNLAFVGLDGYGNVIIVLRNNKYTGRYNVRSVPSVVIPFNTSFRSILRFENVSSNEQFVFIIDPNGLNVRSMDVFRPTCMVNDTNCENCIDMPVLQCVFPENSFTKLCEDGKTLNVTCPLNTDDFDPKMCNPQPVSGPCDASFLDALNAEVVPPTSMVDYSEVVTVQCKPGYNGEDVEYQRNSEENLAPVNGMNLTCEPGENPGVLLGCCISGGLVALSGIGLILYFSCCEKNSTPAVRNAALFVMGVGFLLIAVGLVVGLPDVLAAVVCGSIIMAGGIIEGFVGILLFGGCIKSGKKNSQRVKKAGILPILRTMSTTPNLKLRG